MMVAERAPLVQVQHLKKYFPITRGLIIQRHVGDIKAVDDVSFNIYQGETLGQDDRGPDDTPALRADGRASAF